ncbi:unnamed protein product [Prorocentrum cordatum]|uniref:Uncharacterized protein n=1 Tax=Prorocentrum cordatum TaxID=2364126 RepID=A0ABN9S7Q8_9DINO|nr:unnamed protein product [Polarella glacialis]
MCPPGLAGARAPGPAGAARGERAVAGRPGERAAVLPGRQRWQGPAGGRETARDPAAGDGREAAQDLAASHPRADEDDDDGHPCGGRRTVSEEIMRRAAHFCERNSARALVAWTLDGRSCVAEDEGGGLVRRQCQELNARYEAGFDVTASSLPSLGFSDDESSPSGSASEEAPEEAPAQGSPAVELLPPAALAWPPCDPAGPERENALQRLQRAVLRRRGAGRGQRKARSWAPLCAQVSAAAWTEEDQEEVEQHGAKRPPSPACLRLGGTPDARPDGRSAPCSSAGCRSGSCGGPGFA